jgi:hypothetical protein
MPEVEACKKLEACTKLEACKKELEEAEGVARNSCNEARNSCNESRQRPEMEACKKELEACTKLEARTKLGACKKELEEAEGIARNSCNEAAGTARKSCKARNSCNEAEGMARNSCNEKHPIPELQTEIERATDSINAIESGGRGCHALGGGNERQQIPEVETERESAIEPMNAQQRHRNNTRNTTKTHSLGAGAFLRSRGVPCSSSICRSISSDEEITELRGMNERLRAEVRELELAHASMRAAVERSFNLAASREVHTHTHTHTNTHTHTHTHACCCRTLLQSRRIA